MRAFLDRIAPALCWFGIIGMSMVILAALIVAGLSFRDTRGDEGAAAMGIAIALMFGFPITLAISGVICLIGALLCRSAMRKSGTNEFEPLIRRCRQFTKAACLSWVVCSVIAMLAQK